MSTYRPEDLEHLETLAVGQVRSWFELREGTDTRPAFYAAKDDAPEVASGLVRAVHLDMLPDDYKYRFLIDALDRLEELSADEARDDIEPDIYTHDLAAWFCSNTQRPGYCDEAVSEGLVGGDGTVLDTISAGQLMERREVFDLAVQWLADYEIVDDDDPNDADR